MNQENKQLPTAKKYFIETKFPFTGLCEETELWLQNNELAQSSIRIMEKYKDLHTAPLREELEKLRKENEQFRRLYMKALDHRAKLREALDKFAVMGQEDGNLNGEYHVLTSTGTEKYPVSEAVRVAKNILELVNHIAKEALKGVSNE